MNKTFRLDTGWEFSGFPADSFRAEAISAEAQWLDAQVPGDVHTDLLRHGLIGDPAVGANDAAARWVENQVWVYRTRFDLSKEELESDALEIRFTGLDTYADIYVNGQHAARYENMFVEHMLNLKPFAHVGENKLTVVFWPIALAEKRTLPEGFWINYSTERAYARKAGYAFGWDWTPRVCTMGIWRPAVLHTVRGGCLDGLQCATLFCTPDGESATVRFTAQRRSFLDGCRVRFTVFDGETAVAQCETAQESAEITLQNPKLWWTNDLGDPFLYTVRAELLGPDGAVLDSRARRFGVRTIRIETQNAQGEARFLMVLNGTPVFARGANWVPISNRIASVPDKKYRAVLARARDAGMNTLCVWGGGIYEQEVFYDFCDENGILVWQYFMFACGEYPDFDERFCESVRDEVFQSVRRLSGHPCIALWIGNVEGQMLCEKIGLNRPMYGASLFEKMIPGWLQEADDTGLYLPSSPWGETSANGMDSGDRHNWDVWFTDIPYTDYCKDTTLFASEFGVHAAPVRQTVEKYAGEVSPALDSFAFQYINRDQSLDRMAYYLRQYTGMPATLDSYIRDTMLVQALALQCACGHYRKNFPRCGGALIWQLNDCCGAHSWSLVDYDNIPKAAWYFAKQFFAPMAVYLEEVDAVSTNVWVMNNGPRPIQTSVLLELGDFLGERRYEENLPISLGAGETKLVKTVQAGGRFYPNVILANRQRLYYLAARLSGDVRPVTRFFERPKDLLLPPVRIEEQWETDRVTLRSDLFAHFVYLEGNLEGLELSDNYFDLLPGTSRTISLRAAEGPSISARGLRWTARNSN